MNKFIFLSLALLLLIQIAKADVISCTVNPQEVNLSASIQVTVQLNNTQNVTANDTVEISFPTAYLSCTECVKQVTIEPYSTKSISFTLQALSATTQEQSINVIKPTSYACPPVSKITAADTTPPTVGSVSPTSVVSDKSTTFTASVSDNVGVIACNFSSNSTSYLATVSNNIASVTMSLSEGTRSAYFKCWDAAGNIGTGAATTITSSKPQLSASITLPKKTYYPVESFEPRVIVRDDEKSVVDATVSGNLIYGNKSTYISFFYSTLCDCYKGSYWLGEGALPGDYTLTITAVRSGYQSAIATTTFSLIKPSLQMTMSTDKSEYNPGDFIKVTVDVKDILGNAITDASVRGEIRDASTGSLIVTAHPRSKDSNYYYEYYVGSDSLGKSYTISMSVSWKEQSASASKTISITKRGLNAEMVLEKDVLKPGDTLQGKIKVFDKNSNIIADAKVNVEVKGHAYDKPAEIAMPTSFRWLSSEYKDGFYEIEKWVIENNILPGNYTLSARIEKDGDA
ncbi:MAG: hypothetical protein V1900_01910, partial [Candidatus Aenigmatarchaeota archaeon]